MKHLIVPVWTILALSAGASQIANAQTPVEQLLISIVPCRVADTRYGTTQYGGDALAARETRTIAIAGNSLCDIPTTASAYVLNVAVVPSGPLAYLTVWPTGQPQPTASLLNSPTGQTIASGGIFQAGTNGDINVYASNPTQVIIDVTGYFVPVTPSPSPTLGTGLTSVEEYSGTATVPGIGVTNGVNQIFTLSALPASIPEVYLNGIHQTVNRDYTIAGQIITFLTPRIPSATDSVVVDYWTDVSAPVPQVHSAGSKRKKLRKRQATSRRVPTLGSTSMPGVAASQLSQLLQGPVNSSPK